MTRISSLRSTSALRASSIFDVYHQGDADAVIDNKALTMEHGDSWYPIYTMSRRIGRWENISSSHRDGYGVWVEPDCIWSIDHFYPFEKVDAIFSDGFHLRFAGDSNHQFSVVAATRELVPNTKGQHHINAHNYGLVHFHSLSFVLINLRSDLKPKFKHCSLTVEHNLSFQWFFFRGTICSISMSHFV